MQRYRFLWIGLLGLLAGCTENALSGVEDAGEEGVVSSSVTLQLAAPQEHIDSAHIFFFRIRGNTDTLIFRQMIYNIEYLKPHEFKFDLPAGKYTMFVFGNIPTQYVVSNPPYSSDDIYFDYQGGHEPSAVAFGRNLVTAGTDTANLSGMLLLTSFVGLTIREVPDGVDHMIVRVLNTASGVKMNSGYIDEMMNPPLADTLYSVQKDSTYLSDFYFFPGVGTDKKNTLEVDCLSATNELLYTGSSAPFAARPGYGYKIACSFGPRALQGKAKKGIPIPLPVIFEYIDNDDQD